MSEPDSREARLPVWAQHTLRVLRMRLAEREEEIREHGGAMPGAVAFANPYGAFPRPVACVGEEIQWLAVSGRSERRFHVRMRADGTLEVRGSGRLVVRPNVSNSVTLEVEQR